MTHNYWTDFTRRTDVFGVQLFAIYGFLIFLDRIAGFGVRDATLTEMFVASALGATMSTIALAAITLLARKLYLRRADICWRSDGVASEGRADPYCFRGEVEPGIGRRSTRGGDGRVLRVPA
jgi:hypothetical protein